jgi:TetR/AcrR family transcriptional regulator, regulator of cefoperazone and chloramphenicol sensitivity
VFIYLYMRSVALDSAADLTARARIRERALELFAARGLDAVTVREIAAAAGVSPALVVHHYGSKQALREAVDAYVCKVFDALLEAVSELPAQALPRRPEALAGFAELMVAHLPGGSVVPAYLRRLLLSGDEAGRDLFRRWYALTVAHAEELTAAGVMRRSDDAALRAAFLLVNDLAVVLLRDQLADVLGVDPLTPAGARRWAAETLDAYARGVFTTEGS